MKKTNDVLTFLAFAGPPGGPSSSKLDLPRNPGQNARQDRSTVDFDRVGTPPVLLPLDSRISSGPCTASRIWQLKLGWHMAMLALTGQCMN